MSLTPKILQRKNLPRKKPTRNRLRAKQSLSLRFLNTTRQIIKQVITPVILLGLGALVGLYGFPYLEARINQPLGKVVVEGDLQYLSRREVIQIVPVFEGDRWLDIPLDEVQRMIENIPWIYSAQVSRQWPNELHIRLQEQKPIARWNDDQVLNQYGEVFARDGKVIKRLPLLIGKEGKAEDVMNRFQEFSRLLAPLHLRLAELSVDEQLSWRVVLNNGAVLQVGSIQVMERMQRFVFLYREVLANAQYDVASVDLRYGSGAAVQWQAKTRVNS